MTNASRYKTPLRYPGGKQKLSPFLVEVLAANKMTGCDYAEPYAGGAGVAIELLLTGKVRKIHLNDSSRAIYSFWYSVINHTDEFCERIRSAKMAVTEWRRQKVILAGDESVSDLDLGFSLFFLNRCNRSGIPNAGLIGGLSQTGKWRMDARFPRSDLITRVRAIAAKKEFIALSNMDAERFVREKVSKMRKNTLVYCDPPYFNKASRLYLNHYKPDDHQRIAKVIQTELDRPWLVSYDGVPEILGFYAKRRYFLYDLQYNAAKAYKGKEVFVFSDDLDVPTRSILPAVDMGLQTVA